MEWHEGHIGTEPHGVEIEIDKRAAVLAAQRRYCQIEIDKSPKNTEPAVAFIQEEHEGPSCPNGHRLFEKLRNTRTVEKSHGAVGV